MKNKKNLIMGLAASALIATTSVGVIGCGKPAALELKLESGTTGTVKAGQGLEVKFAIKGFEDFTYAIGGDAADYASFDKDTRIFTAERAGTYVLTISAVKGDTKKEFAVTITVTAAGDNAALQAEIARAAALVEADYTTVSWNALKTALADANEIVDEATASQDDLDAVKDALSAALADLRPKTLARAALASDESSVTYNGVTYSASAYFNYDAFLTKVKALNADTAVQLNSVYAAEFAKLAAELEARIRLTVSGLFDARGGVVTTADNTVRFTASADQNAAVRVYRVAGAEKTEITATEGVYAVTPDWDTACTVRVEARKGADDATLVTRDYVFTLHALGLSVRDGVHNGGSDMTKLIKAENNEITTLGATPFEGSVFNAQAYLDSMDVEGDFIARFSVTYNGKWDDNNNNVVWVGMAKANAGSDIDWNGYACARYGAAGSTEELEIRSRGPNNMIRGDLDNAVSMAQGSKITYEYARRAVRDGEGALLGWNYSFSAIHPETGAYAGTVTDSVMKADHPYDVDDVSRVRICFGFENIKATVSDISVVSDRIYDKLPLSRLVKNAESGQYVQSDYTDASWDAFSDATALGWTYLNGFRSTQAEIDQMAAALEAAIEGLTSIDLANVIAQIDEERQSWTYDGVVYDLASYQDVKIDAVQALNARTATDYAGADKIILRSQYDAELRALIGTLVKAVEFEVAGLKTAAYVGETFAPITFTVASAEADSITVKDNDTVLTALEGAYTLAYTESGRHVIEITATKGDKVSRRSYTVEYYRSGFVANHDDVTVADGRITMNNAGQNWDSGYNKAIKACDRNIVFTGDFRVQFDATPLTKKDGNDAWVVAFQAFKGGDWNAAGEYAIRYKDNRVAVHGTNGAEIASADLLKLGVKTTFVVERRGTSASFYILGADGARIGLAERDDMYDGALLLGWNFEYITATVENIEISAEAGTVVDKTALRAAAADAEALREEDFASGWATFAQAKKQARAALDKLGDTPGAVVTQAEVDHALAMLQEARAALVKVGYETATVTETEFSYLGRTYRNTEWFGWAAVKEQIVSLNALSEDMTESAYRSSVLAHVAQMEMRVGFVGLQKHYYFSNLADGAIVFGVTAPDGAAVEVDAGGTPLTAADGVYSLTPGAAGKISLTVTATGPDGDTTVTQTNTIDVNVGGMEIFRDDDTLAGFIDKTEGGFRVTQSTEWGGHNERKAYVGNVQAAGNFSYSADFTYHENFGGASVATLHTGMSTADASPRRGIYLAIRYQQTDGVEALEIGDWGSNVRFNLAAEDLDCIRVGGKIRATLSREITGDKYVYTAVFVNPATGKELGRRVWNDITDAGRKAQLEVSQLSFNFEHCGVTVDRIALSGDAVVDRSALGAAIARGEAVSAPTDELQSVLDAMRSLYGGDALPGGVDQGDVCTQAALDALLARFETLMLGEELAQITVRGNDGATTLRWVKQEGVTVAVAVDGEPVTAEGDTYSYTAADEAEHRIAVTATKGDQTLTRTFTVRNVASFTVDPAVQDRIAVTEGKIVCNDFSGGWDFGTNRKVRSGVRADGDFRVEFDVTVHEVTAANHVVALQLGDGDQRGEFAIRFHTGRLALKQIESAEIAGMRDPAGVKFHFVAERIGKYGTFYVTDAAGAVLGRTGWGEMIEGEREIMFNFEDIKATVENVRLIRLAD